MKMCSSLGIQFDGLLLSEFLILFEDFFFLDFLSLGALIDSMMAAHSLLMTELASSRSVLTQRRLYT